MAKCPHCNGSGEVPGMKPGFELPCPVCRSSGEIPDSPDQPEREVGLTPEEYRQAQRYLVQLAQELERTPERFHPLVHRRTGRVLTTLGSCGEPPDAKTLQEARGHLLLVQESLEEGRHHATPTPQRAINLCDKVLELLPSEG